MCYNRHMKKINSPQLVILIVLSFAVLFIFNNNAFAEIKKGSTRAEVVNKFGEPNGVMTMGKEDIFTYPGGMIVLIDGIVDQIDANFEAQLEQRVKEDKYSESQKEKGLTKHKGEWITKEAKKQIDVTKAQQQPIRILRGGGRAVEISEILVPGKITIVDFYADWCGPCKKMAPYLVHIAQKDPDVYLRQIDIVKWGTPVTSQYGIRSIPDVRVFDRNGRMVGKPTHDFNEILSYIGRSK